MLKSQTQSQSREQSLISNRSNKQVAELRAELFELRHVVKEFSCLNQQLEALEGKYQLLLDEKQRGQREQKVKTEVDQSTCDELKEELDELTKKAEVIATNREKLEKDNTALKRMIEAKGKQIEFVKRQTSGANSKLDKKRAEVAGKYALARSLKEEKNRAEDEVMTAKQKIDQGSLKQKQIERDLKARELDNVKLEKRLLTMNSNLQESQGELARQTEELRRSNSKLASLERAFDDLVQQLKTLEDDNARRKEQCQQALNNYQQESQHNKQLTLKLSKLESEVKHKERELDDLTKKRNTEMLIHDRQQALNQTLNGKLDQNIEAIQEYQQINQQLVEEIRAYCKTDQKAREILNRTGRMQEVLARVEKKVRGSGAPIQHIFR